MVAWLVVFIFLLFFWQLISVLRWWFLEIFIDLTSEIMWKTNATFGIMLSVFFHFPSFGQIDQNFDCRTPQIPKTDLQDCQADQGYLQFIWFCDFLQPVRHHLNFVNSSLFVRYLSTVMILFSVNLKFQQIVEFPVFFLTSVAP